MGVWLLTSHDYSPVVAVSAVLGATLAVLPAAATAGRSGLGRRLIGFSLGGLVALVVVSLTDLLLPPSRSSTSLVTTVAVLVVALLVVLIVSRTLALPTLLGAVVVALGILVAPASTGSQLALATIVPAVVAAIVASAVAGRPTENPVESSVAPSEDSSVSLDVPR